jgi:hypothetical protein
MGKICASGLHVETEESAVDTLATAKAFVAFEIAPVVCDASSCSQCSTLAQALKARAADSTADVFWDLDGRFADGTTRRIGTFAGAGDAAEVLSAILGRPIVASSSRRTVIRREPAAGKPDRGTLEP